MDMVQEPRPPLCTTCRSLEWDEEQTIHKGINRDQGSGEILQKKENATNAVKRDISGNIVRVKSNFQTIIV